MLEYTLTQKYMFISHKIYIKSLTKLNNEQILSACKMLYQYNYPKHEVIQNTIREYMNRQISLKIIVYHLAVFVIPAINTVELNNMLLWCYTPQFITPGEYWDTVKDGVSKSSLNTTTIERILHDCLVGKKLSNVQDINDNLLNKLHPVVRSQLDGTIVANFKNLLTWKVRRDSEHAAPRIQEFGERAIETIASPDSEKNLPRVESPKRYDIKSTNKSHTNETRRCENQGINVMNEPYKIHLIGN